MPRCREDVHHPPGTLPVEGGAVYGIAWNFGQITAVPAKTLVRVDLENARTTMGMRSVRIPPGDGVAIAS